MAELLTRNRFGKQWGWEVRGQSVARRGRAPKRGANADRGSGGLAGNRVAEGVSGWVGRVVGRPYTYICSLY